MSYNKPALIEIYTELFLVSGSFDYSHALKAIPALEAAAFSKHDVVNSVETVDSQPLLVPRLRCWDGKKKSLVQLSPGVIIINRVAPYLGWGEYTGLFKKGFGAINAVHQKLNPVSINLVTIDELKVPKDSFRAGKYLNCNGDIIPKWYENQTEPFDIVFGKGFIEKNKKNRRINISARESPTDFLIRWESAFHENLSEKNIFQVLNELHEESNNTFEGLITNETRNEVMKGKRK